MLMQSDTEAQLACLLKLNNVYSTSCLFSSLCNLQTLACDLALAFSAQACKFTPTEQYIISTKPDIFLWTDLATNWMLLIPCRICIFSGKWKMFFLYPEELLLHPDIFFFLIKFQTCADENSSKGEPITVWGDINALHPRFVTLRLGQKSSIFPAWAKPKA